MHVLVCLLQVEEAASVVVDLYRKHLVLPEFLFQRNQVFYRKPVPNLSLRLLTLLISQFLVML